MFFVLIVSFLNIIVSCQSVVLYNQDQFSIPRFRFVEWADSEQKVLAADANYDEDTWNNLGTNSIEDLAFGDNQDVQSVLSQMGFEEGPWDCWMNHYNGYYWSNLEEYGIAPYFEALGWNAQAWDGPASGYPESDSKAWDELDSIEQQAAANICYIPETWDQVGSFATGWLETSEYLSQREPWVPAPPSTSPPTSPPTSSPVDITRAPVTAAPITAAPNTMNPMTSAPSAPPKKICFPGKARVTVFEKGVVELSDVSVGDKVLVGPDNQYETVYSFGHSNPEIRSNAFLTIHTNKKSLTLTPNHMISTERRGVIPASMVNKGDRVWIMTTTTQNNNKNNKTGEQPQQHLTADVVTHITTNVSRKGMYAPFTDSGYLVVDDFVVSNYVALVEEEESIWGWVSHQWMAHAFTLPRRWYCQHRDCTKETYTSEEGLATWIAPLFYLAQGVLEHPFVVVRTIGLLGFIAVGGAVHFVFEYTTTMVLTIVVAALVGLLLPIRIKTTASSRKNYK